MRETSPYEGTFDQLNGRSALGRVVDVDTTNRRCRVKTIGLKSNKVGRGTDDQDVADVQWITTAGSDNGAEDTSIPKVGQIGVLLYINHEPYLIGFFRPLPESSVDNPNPKIDPLEALMTEGDRKLSTIGGNSVILRSGGSIEIRSTALCRTYWLPTNLLTSVCGDYELSTDGGQITWTRDKTTNAELLECFILDNQQPTNVIDAQFGTTEAGNVIDLVMGSADGDTLEIATEKFAFHVDPNGTTTIRVGNGKATLVIDAATGKIDVTTSADANVTASGIVTVKAEKIILNEESSGITTLNSHLGVVDLITNVPVLPSETVFGDI